MSGGDRAELLHQAIRLDHSGQRQDAEKLYAQLNRTHPDFADAWNWHAIHLLGEGRASEALPLIDRALEILPRDISFNLTAAAISTAAGQPDRAMVHYRRTIALDNAVVAAHTNLGVLLKQAGKTEEAIRHLVQAATLAPEDFSVRFNLGTALMQDGQFAAAELEIRAALRLDPVSIEAHLALASIIMQLRSPDAAAQELQLAADAFPGETRILTFLARLHEHSGRLDEAMEALDRATTLQPNDAKIGSMRISLSRLLPRLTAQDIASLSREWAETFADPLTRQARPVGTVPTPEKTLRIGYIGGPSMRHHTGAYSLVPLIEAHDPGEVQIYCYSDVPPSSEDDVSQRLRDASRFRVTHNLNDEQLADAIRGDQIDILVETYGHSSGSRLLALARHPAPLCGQLLSMGSVQMEAVDFSFLDPVLAPEGLRGDIRETIVDLPFAFLYHPMRDVAMPDQAQQLQNPDHLTFVSFNQSPKLNAETLDAWGQILAALPHATLLLKGMGLDGPETLSRLQAAFGKYGISPGRITVLPYSAKYIDHMQSYSRADIALDTWPYGSIITACEALWMGVPLVAWSSDRVLGRYSTLFNTELEMADLIAGSKDQYVAKVLRLAADVDRRRTLRRTLRARFQASRLYDAKAFAQSIERAYRNIWQDWCRKTF